MTVQSVCLELCSELLFSEDDRAHIERSARAIIDPTALLSVLGDAVPADETAEAPSWIQLTPKQHAVKGFASRDGRRFKVADLKALVAQLNAASEHHPMDIDHGSEMAGGLFSTTTTEAFGWLTEFAVRHGSELWGRVEWTADGAALIAAKKFRGISPAFTIDRTSWYAYREDPEKAPPMLITGISSAALTNRPALLLRSLNTLDGESEMTHAALCKLFGLPETATPAELETAISSRSRVQTLSIEDAVPRADYEALRLKNAELEAAAQVAVQAARETRDAALLSEINGAIDDAAKTGKISPASKDYHRESCTRGDYDTRVAALAAFRKYVEVQPVLIDNTQSERAQAAIKVPTVATDPKSIARLMNVTPAEREKALADMRGKPEIYNPHAYRIPAV